MNSNISTNILNELDNILKEHDKEILQKISKHYSIDINELNKLFDLEKEVIKEDRLIINSKDDIQKMKLPQLKILCKKYKLKSSGSKQSLIDRLWEFNENYLS